MKAFQKIAGLAAPWSVGLLLLAGGCCWPEKTPTPPLGTQSDMIWRRQAIGASASEFVMHEHEFAYYPDDRGRVRLNQAGEDHLRSIAARLHCGAPMPVIVERSATSVAPESEHQYPVNPDSDLDMKRREYIVKSLVALGITNADQCVVVAPRLAPGANAAEAARAFQGGANRRGGGGGGGGGGNRIVSSYGSLDSIVEMDPTDAMP
jgi:hypothetical protein